MAEGAKTEATSRADAGGGGTAASPAPARGRNGAGHAAPAAPALQSGFETAAAAAAFAALGSEARLQILRALVRAGDAGLAVGEIQARLAVPASTLSHHLRLLVAAGLVAQTRQGRELRCRTDYASVRALSDYLVAECCADAPCCAEEVREKPAP